MHLYGLHNGDGIIRYIGITTCKDPRVRLRGHRKEARGTRRSSPVYKWMRKHGPEKIELVVIASFGDLEALNAAEQVAIESTPNLLNVHRGGYNPGPYPSRNVRKNGEYCRQGHRYDEVGFTVRDGKYRQCSACHKVYMQKYNQRVMSERPEVEREKSRLKAERLRRAQGILPRNYKTEED